MEIIYYLIIAILVVYLIVFVARELVILVLLRFRGKYISANLESVFAASRFSHWRRYPVYNYRVSDHDYQRIRVRWLFDYEVPKEIQLMYLPNCPQISRIQVSFSAFIGQVLFYGFLYCLIVPVLSLYPIVNLPIIQFVALLFVVVLLISPRLTMHPIMIHLYEPQIPKHAYKEYIR